jgi:hypothetical protein
VQSERQSAQQLAALQAEAEEAMRQEDEQKRIAAAMDMEGLVVDDALVSASAGGSFLGAPVPDEEDDTARKLVTAGGLPLLTASKHKVMSASTPTVFLSHHVHRSLWW